MCESVVDIQSATAEIRPGKKEEEERIILLFHSQYIINSDHEYKASPSLSILSGDRL